MRVNYNRLGPHWRRNLLLFFSVIYLYPIYKFLFISIFIIVFDSHDLGYTSLNHLKNELSSIFNGEGYIITFTIIFAIVIYNAWYHSSKFKEEFYSKEYDQLKKAEFKLMSYGYEKKIGDTYYILCHQLGKLGNGLVLIKTSQPIYNIFRGFSNFTKCEERFQTVENRNYFIQHLIEKEQ